MCDHCSNTPDAPPLSRRTILTALAAAGVAALAACTAKPESAGVMTALPDPEEIHHAPPPTWVPPEPIHIPETPKTPAPSEVGPVIPRSAWTAAVPNAAALVPMNGVKLITFHHSGDGKAFLADDVNAVARHLEGVRQWHIHRGMADIGYHFAIDRAGRVWQLRHLKYEGQHVRPSANGTRWNAHNIGIVILGDFSKQTLTQAQKDRINTFAAFLVKRYNLPPTAVHYHGELVHTDCPGRALAPIIAQLRARSFH